MNDKLKVGIAIAGTAIAVAGGGALAAGKGGDTTHAGAPPGLHGRDGVLTAAAGYLGLTTVELRTQLGSGKTLAQLAQAQGKTTAGLEDALTVAVKADLDADVAAGRLTAAQEATLLAGLRAHLDALVSSSGIGHHGRGRHGVELTAAATYLGLSAGELRTQLESGKSLAEIAKAQGKSVDGLKDALVTEFRAHLDQIVNAKHTGGPGLGHGDRGGHGGHGPGFGFGPPGP